VVSRRAIAATVLAALIATGIGIALSYAIHWFPAQASTQAKKTDTLYRVLVIASVPIFVLVVTTILFSVYHFRMRPGQELQDGPPIHGNTRLEVLWTAVPALLLLALVAYSFVVLRDNEKAPAAGREIKVEVTGQQFAWSYSYPSSVTGGKPVYATQLYLPENESVDFEIRSKDVIHAFWIPAFRLQIDAVPGIATHYRATPDRLGAYPVVCNLLCGVGHGLMRSQAHVVTPAAFQAWIAGRAGKPPAPGSQTAPALNSGYGK
jgi:cytochrome c oxidase subunit II